MYFAGPNGYTDALSVFSGKTGFAALRDRFGFLNRFSPYNLYEPHLPMYPSDSGATLAELMDARSEELMRRYGDTPLYIFYSGGVDSTALTVALLRAADGRFGNLHVVYTPSALEEYPSFLEHLQRLGLAMHFIPAGESVDDFQEQALKTGKVMTGWCADQLFGSIIHLFYPDWYFKDWRPWLGYSDAVQQMEAAFAHYGLPVKTFGEFAWFMNFACKYNYVKHMDVMSYGYSTGNMVAFYDTEAFNTWSVSNFDRLHRYMQSDTRHYKEDLKAYIFAYNGDSSYRDNKGKEGSWGHRGTPDTAYPVMAVSMESPDSVHTVNSGLSLPCGMQADSMRHAMNTNLLQRYLRTKEGTGS